MNYLVVLFKNKERKKIINKFKTLERADNFFKNLISDNEKVIFETLVENANYVQYEVGLLEKSNTNFDLYFVKDKLGRQVKIEIDDPEYKIIKISNYRYPEKIYDVQKKNKISFNDFLNQYLPKNNIKLISRLNNKIAVQNDDDVNLFSLKNEMESKRFLDSLSDYLISVNRIDCIIVSETSKEQKKYLYDLLSQKGISKQSLYRVSTTFKTRK